MVVTCPKCGSRYAVDPLAIGPSGRTVQCARCNQRWFEKVESAVQSPDVVTRPVGPVSALPAVIPPKPTTTWHRPLAIAAVVVVLVAVALFAFRREISTMISYEARASTSAAPGQPESARPMIEVDLASSKIEVVDGRYVVRGQIVNNGKAPGSTTLLRLTFRKDDDVLGERAFALVEGPLPPGGRANFSQLLDDPPSGTTDIVPAVE